MLTRAHRFHGRSSLRFVYQHGQTVRAQQLACRYAANPRRQTYRVAVVVSRKVHKSAVIRNRIRRRLYEAIRDQESDFGRPFDMVITVFSDTLADMPTVALRNTLQQTMQRAGLLERAKPVSGAVAPPPKVSPVL